MWDLTFSYREGKLFKVCRGEIERERERERKQFSVCSLRVIMFSFVYYYFLSSILFFH